MNRGVNEHQLPPKSGKSLRSSRWIPPFVLLASLSLTALAVHFDSLSREGRYRFRFQRNVQHAEDTIQNRLRVYTALLQATSGIFTMQSHVDRREFNRFVAHLGLQQSYPGILGIGFALRTPASQAQALASSMRGQGFSDFRIWPAGKRAWYAPVVYIEPLSGRNRVAIGYDMSSDPIRRAALLQSRDTGEPAVSRAVRLLQETNPRAQPGFVIFCPVYHQGAPVDTVSQRRGSFVGAVYAGFRAAALFDRVMARAGGVLTCQVYESTNIGPANRLFASPRTPPDRYRTVAHIQVAGSIWTLVFTPSASFQSEMGRGRAVDLLLAGIVISLLLFLISRAQVLARSAAEKAAREQEKASQEISALNTRLQRAMAETHHRVKNNLQVVASLAELQLREEDGPIDPESVHTLVQHIRSLAVIHDILTAEARKESDVQFLHTRQALERLQPLLAVLVGARPLEFEVQDLLLPLQQATAVTVLVNELVSNAVKHGAGRIKLNLETLDGHARLVVSDGGRGFPPGFNAARDSNTGLDLVESLSRLDLHGAAKFDNQPGGGARVSITFPISAPDRQP
ncbi:MAG TPA: CHASE domain-containing protein [Chthonomonadales bacterium]|nr:CHASE domain-containing protein [Chthonomonadales bacterium]